VAAVDLDGSVESLGNLQQLCIKKICRLPSWINPASLVLLSDLYIDVAQLREEDIQVLGMLPALRDLRVRAIVADDEDRQAPLLGRRFMVSPDAFPCVQLCRFHGFSTVPSMFPPGAMPMLENFDFHVPWEDLSGGGEFSFHDLALCHLPSLQLVNIYLGGKQNVSEEMVTKVEDALRQQARMPTQIIPPSAKVIVYCCSSDSIESGGPAWIIRGLINFPFPRPLACYQELSRKPGAGGFILCCVVLFSGTYYTYLMM